MKNRKKAWKKFKKYGKVAGRSLKKGYGYSKAGVKSAAKDIGEVGRVISRDLRKPRGIAHKPKHKIEKKLVKKRKYKMDAFGDPFDFNLNNMDFSV